MREVFEGYVCMSATDKCIYAEEDLIDGVPPCSDCANCISVEQLAELER